MKKITFKFENTKKVEEFLGAKLYCYFNSSTHEATFKFPAKEGLYKEEELKIKIGDTLFKNRKGEIFIQINK